MKLTVGQLLQIYLTQNKLTQSDLAKKVGCSRAFISMMIHNRKRPGMKLSKRIADTLSESATEREGLEFYLLSRHQTITVIERDYPNAVKDFRSTRNGEDNEGLRIC